MDPRTRKLLKVVIPDGMEVHTSATMHDLMGSDPSMRASMLMNYRPREGEVPV